MAQTLQHPLPNRAFPPNSNDETVIVSAGTPIVLSVWRGDAGAPTVVFLPGTMSHPLFYADHLDGPVALLGSSQGGILAMVVAARSRRLALVPLWACLDLDRVCGQPETRRRFETDLLSLRCYPLRFLDELSTADVSGMRDGSIGWPVLVIPARGDPLFSFAYTRRVLDRIVAPAKELLVFDVDRHLLFNECVELVTGPLVDRIRRLVAAPTTAEKGGPR
jgi:alpha-beta hydrolase superfamily lysophospholipase